MTSKNHQQGGEKYRHIVGKTRANPVIKQQQKGNKHGHDTGKTVAKFGDSPTHATRQHQF